MIVALFGGRSNIEVVIFFVILIEREVVFVILRNQLLVGARFVIIFVPNAWTFIRSVCSLLFAYVRASEGLIKIAAPTLLSTHIPTTAHMY